MRIAELFEEEELYRESSRFVLDNPGGWTEQELNTLSQETLLKLEKRSEICLLSPVLCTNPSYQTQLVFGACPQARTDDDSKGVSMCECHAVFGSWGDATDNAVSNLS